MADPPSAEAAPPSPTTRSRRLAKGKARAVPVGPPARSSGHSAGPSATRKGSKSRISTPESEGPNDSLFDAPSNAGDVEVVEGGGGDGGKRARSEELPRVEVEGASPPHKARKVTHVASGEVIIYLHVFCGSPGLILSAESVRPLHREGHRRVQVTRQTSSHLRLCPVF